MTVVPVFKAFLAGQNTCYDSLVDLWFNLLSPYIDLPFFSLEFLHQVCLHLFHLPHVMLNHVIALSLYLRLTILGHYASIGQVLELVLCIVWVVVLSCETQVGLFPHPDAQGLDTGDEDPHSDIEFLAHDDQWPLNVLLDDPDALETNLDSLDQLIQVRVDLDATPARQRTRLNDPKITQIGQAELLWADKGL